MKIGTVALIVSCPQGEPELVETLSDELEIATLESAVASGEDPLMAVQAIRDKRQKEDEEFGNYVEDLLSQPFVPTEVRQHGVQWFRSKNRIEQFQRAESEARSVIADFAFKIFKREPTRQDFVLSSTAAEVRVRIFVIGKIQSTAA